MSAKLVKIAHVDTCGRPLSPSDVARGRLRTADRFDDRLTGRAVRKLEAVHGNASKPRLRSAIATGTSVRVIPRSHGPTRPYAQTLSWCGESAGTLEVPASWPPF